MERPLRASSNRRRAVARAAVTALVLSRIRGITPQDGLHEPGSRPSAKEAYMKTVIGLLDNADEAKKVVEELLQNGFDRDDIGAVSSEVAREAEAALSGASKGILYGGLAGLLLGTVALALPGIGLALVAGPAVPLVSAAFGAAAGGLIGGLTSKGVPEEEAKFYAEGVRRGGTLLVVSAKTDELAARAEDILRRHGAIEIHERAALWRDKGWTGRLGGEETAAATKAQRAEPSAAAAAPKQAPASEPPAPAMAASSPSGTSPSTASAASTPASATPAPAARDRDESVVSAGATPIPANAEPLDEPAIALSAVRVYSFVIDVPDAEPVDALDEAGMAAEPPGSYRYTGPERRMSTTRYSGVERRTSM
jgi:hypothetical protein